MYCTHCGKELFENARFCQACGTPVAGIQTPPPAEVSALAFAVVPDETALFEAERAFLANLYGSLNRERSAWKSMGITLLTIAIFLLIIGGTLFAYGDQGMSVDGEWISGCGVAALISAVVNLRMAKRIRGLCDVVYIDIRSIIDRYSTATPVVFSLLCNVIAMAFILDSMGKLKSKTAVLQRIVQRQQLPQDI